MINHMYKDAKDFSDIDIDIFKTILIKAGEVSEATFEGLIEKNPKILILGEKENPSGIGALKIPNKDYKKKVFRLSKSNENSDKYSFELGWIVSLASGNGNKIMKLLSSFEDKLYTTVREENNKMIHLIKKYGFQQTGVSYKSSRGNYKLLLFIKQ